LVSVFVVGFGSVLSAGFVPFLGPLWPRPPPFGPYTLCFPGLWALLGPFPAWFSALFRVLSGLFLRASGPESGCLSLVSWPFGPSFLVLVFPVFRPFSVVFRRFSALPGRPGPFGSPRALPWPVFPGFRLFSGPFGSLLGPPGVPLPVWLSQGLGRSGFPGFWPLFGLFWPLLGPSGPLCPGFWLYSKVLLGPLAPFPALSRRPVLGPQNTPSRGLLRASRAPNVPLLALSAGPLRGPAEGAVPRLTPRPPGPKCTTLGPFWALFGPVSGRRPESGGILQRFRPLAENAVESRLISGLRPRRGPKGPPGPKTPVFVH